MSEPGNLFEYEPLARERFAPAAWDYVSGGAEDEITLRENRAAFERTFLRPRYLVDISRRDLTTTVLGERLPLPLCLAPTGYHMLAHPEGELETARGANAAGVPMILSSMATRTIEEVAAVATVPLWFQLYMMQDMAINEWLVRRVERSGYRAIFLTVDLVVMGNRERDRRNAFSLAEVRVENLLPHGDDVPASVRQAKNWQDIPWKADLSWRDVEWLRRTTNLPIIVKGVLTPEDARMAYEHGAAGVVVSNHGGRQLDGAMASLDALPEIAQAVGGTRVTTGNASQPFEILLDGGVRRGADILKALALGASAVCIGRPYLWGLAVDGARGVQRVVEALRYELDTAMALTGKPTIREIDASVIWRR